MESRSLSRPLLYQCRATVYKLIVKMSDEKVFVHNASEAAHFEAEVARKEIVILTLLDPRV